MIELNKKYKAVYWSSSLVPSDRANGVNVMHACDVLSRKFRSFELIALVPLKYLGTGKQEIYEKYNVAPFRLRSVFYLGIKGWSVFYLLISFIFVLFSRKDLVITRSVLFAYLSIFLGKRVFLEMHQEEWKRSQGMVKKLSKILLSKKLLGIGVNTDALGQRFLADFQYPAGDVLVLPNGAELEEPTKTEEDYVAEFIQDQLDGYFVAGYSGSLQKGKGAELIVQTANQVTDQSIKFAVLGGKPDEISRLKASVKNDNVVFFGRHPHKYVAAFIHRFDICLLPNQAVMLTGKKSMDTGQVTSPIKLFEYMVAGKAIVASRVEVLGEILKDSFSIQVGTQDTTGWTEAILRLKSSEEKRLAMGMLARQEVIDHYTWEKRGQRLFTFVDNRM